MRKPERLAAEGGLNATRPGWKIVPKGGKKQFIEQVDNLMSSAP